MKASSDKLWMVVGADRAGNRSPKLWILAATMERAASKAKRWLKRHGYVDHRIAQIESHGTIDVF